MNKKPTEDEHYIAQVHLKGFSPNYAQYKKDKKTKCFIYYYDLINNEQQKAVPVESVCFKKNLYEFTNNEDEIVYRNLIEKTLSSLESMFGHYRDELEKKAFNEENYNTPCFLRKEEKIFWATYILIQMLRVPQVLEVAAKITKEVFAENVNHKQARNLSLLYCLPFYKEIDMNSPEASLMNNLLEPMLDMYFSVCVDKKGRFITSDKAMYIYSPEFPCEEYERVIFPITSQLCLILIGRELKQQCNSKNFLFPANEDAVEQVFADMARSAFEKIYTNHELYPKELKLLKDAMSTKESVDWI
ncbi:MAG: DUF4238 domain-containing protein [Lachnospiraceae bacterium]|nr:DUF4238 domain-containing protein [Lachnospiraceae bacterium]